MFLKKDKINGCYSAECYGLEQTTASCLQPIREQLSELEHCNDRNKAKPDHGSFYL